jgi:hypothetical protein
VWTLSARLLLAATAVALPLAGAAPAQADHPVEGTLQGVHADYFDAGSSETRWQLDTGAQTLDVLPTTLPALTPEAAAVAVDDKDPGAGVAGPVSAAAPQAAPALGGRRTAVIAFNFATNPTSQPWTTAEIESRIFKAGDSASAFFREQSYDRLWLTGRDPADLAGDVYGWYTLPIAPTGCNYRAIADEAQEWAAQNGFVADDYQHVMYVFPATSACGWAGLAYMPGWESWINGDLSVRVTAHELSHNLGIHHAGALSCTGASGQAVPISSNCVADASNEYNDPFDVMGNWGSRHSNGWHLQQLGFLQPTNVQTVTSSGTYSMTSALDSTTEPTTLRVPRTYTPGGAVQNWFYLEVREAGKVFESFPGGFGSALTGVSIRAVDNPSQLTQSRLVDTDAGGSIVDAPLEAGKTFSDGRVAVTTLAAGAGSATVAIDMAAPPLDQQAPSRPTGLAHSLLKGGVRLSWDGSADNVGVSSYAVYRDGIQVATAPAASFDDTTVLPGQHVYTVYAEDGVGNRSAASDPHLVTVPAARVSRLRSGSVDRTRPRLSLVRRRVRGGRLLLTARARDGAGVARVELRVDGRRVVARRANRLSYRWRLRPGRHRFVAIAYDRRGNRATERLSLLVRRP